MRIEINLSGVRYLDAAGMGELVACQALSRRSGVTMRLTGAFGKALELLRLTGLDRLISGTAGARRLASLGHGTF